MSQFSRGFSPLPTPAGQPAAPPAQHGQFGAPGFYVYCFLFQWTVQYTDNAGALFPPDPTRPVFGPFATAQEANAFAKTLPPCQQSPAQAPPQPTQPPSGGTPAQGPTTPVATQSGGGEVAASGLCANLGYIPPCVGGWPSPQRSATDGTCDKWVSFVGQIVKLGSLLLQSSGEGNPSRLDSNWVKNVVCACIDFDPGQLRGMPPLEYLYSHLGQCDFSEAYLAIASTVHGLNGTQLQAAYAVKAALEALSSIEYGVNTGYGQDQGEGQHSELGLGI